MTTIAADGVTVAADGRRVSGHELVEECCVKLVKRDGTIYGLTGEAAVFDAAVAWHRDGCKKDEIPKASKDESWSLLVFMPSVMHRYTNDSIYPDKYPYPQAFGSGASYAQAALLCGKSAREAVEVAARLDVYTGGEITEFDIDAPLVQKLKEAAE